MSEKTLEEEIKDIIFQAHGKVKLCMCERPKGVFEVRTILENKDNMVDSILSLVVARLEGLKEEKYFFDNLRNQTIIDCIQAIRGK